MLVAEGKGVHLAGKRNSRKADVAVVSEQAWREGDGSERAGWDLKDLGF